MQLRPRRSVLGDISNRASLGGIENASGKSIKKNKRLVIDNHTSYTIILLSSIFNWVVFF